MLSDVVRKRLWPAFAVVLACATALPTSAAAAWSEKVLHHFVKAPDGEYPETGLVMDGKGNLYGATYVGGATDNGAIFELSPPATSGGSWKETVIYSFGGGNDGTNPSSALVLDANGNLFGTTEAGGGGNCASMGPGPGCGAVFELSPPTKAGGDWTETILHRFINGAAGGADGNRPSNLIAGPDGRFYGTTGLGGSSSCGGFDFGCGVVFELDPPATKGGTWTETVLHTFLNYAVSDGAGAGPLVLDAKGNLFGLTAYSGGACPLCGTAYELSPPAKPGGHWSFATLHNFGANGCEPFGLVSGPEGSLYGVLHVGGSATCFAGYGSAFKLGPPAKAGDKWTESLLYSFLGGKDGGDPTRGLVLDAKGNLFGTTDSGGSTYCAGSGCGTVFELSPPSAAGGKWKEAVLHVFGTSLADGQYPEAGVIKDSKGNLYGTTSYPVVFGAGEVFELTP